MNQDQAKIEVEALTIELNKYNHAYYVENNSIISDYEFDQLLKKLQDIESKFPELSSSNSPTKRVGGGHHKEI